MIGFAAPLMLLGGLAVAAPLVIHLMRRPAGPVLVVPSVRHFDAATLRETASQRLRRWLLLLVRCLAVASLAAVFARPAWVGADALAGTLDADRPAGAADRALLLFLDVSGSTRQTDAAGRDVADALSAEALARLDAAAGTTAAVGVVLVGRSARAVMPELTRNTDALREHLNAALTQTEREGPADWHAAWRAGRRLIASSGSALGGRVPTATALVLVTDRQRTDWRAGLVALGREQSSGSAVGNAVELEGSADAGLTVEVGPTLAGALPNARVTAAELVPAVGGRPHELRVDVSAYMGSGDRLPPLELGVLVDGQPAGTLHATRGDVTRSGWMSRRSLSFAASAEPRRVRLAVVPPVVDGSTADNAVEVELPATRRVPVRFLSPTDPRAPLAGLADATRRPGALVWRALRPEADRDASRFDVSWVTEPGPEPELDPSARAASVLVVDASARGAWAVGPGSGRVVPSSAVLAFPAAESLEPSRGQTLVPGVGLSPAARSMLGGLDTRPGRAAAALSTIGFTARAPLTLPTGGEAVLRWSDGRPAAVWTPPKPDGTGGGVLELGFGADPAVSPLAQRGVFAGLLRGMIDGLSGNASASAFDAEALPVPDPADLRRASQAEVADVARWAWSATPGLEPGPMSNRSRLARAQRAAEIGLGEPLWPGLALGLIGLVGLELLLQERGAA